MSKKNWKIMDTPERITIHIHQKVCCCQGLQALYMLTCKLLAVVMAICIVSL